MTVLAKAGDFNQEQLDLLKRHVCQGASNDELMLFVAQCKRTGLDPFSRQIYSLPMGGGKRQVLVSIDGFRLIAERSGKYAGQLGPWWCGDDGVWKDVWVDTKPPIAAKIGVVRSDFKEPLYAVARYASYASGTPIWKKMPDLMIAKVAEALALRRAFPQELSGLYSSEEMDQAQDTGRTQAQPHGTPVVTTEKRPSQPPPPTQLFKSLTAELALVEPTAAELHDTFDDFEATKVWKELDSIASTKDFNQWYAKRRGQLIQLPDDEKAVIRKQVAETKRRLHEKESGVSDG